MMSRLQALLRQLPPLQVNVYVPSDKFDQFPKLPLELRTMIWKLAARQPRLVKVFEIEPQPTRQGSDSVIKGNGPNPGVMAACHDSRKEGLKVYKLVTTRVADPYTGKPVTIYVNLYADIFLLQSPKQPQSPRPVDPNDQTQLQQRPSALIDGYNLDAKYLQRIERLIQSLPHGCTVTLPRNLLKAARIKQYSVLIEAPTKSEKQTLDSGVFEDIARLDIKERVWRFVVFEMRDYGMDAGVVYDWDIDVIWKTGVQGSEIFSGLESGAENPPDLTTPPGPDTALTGYPYVD